MNPDIKDVHIPGAEKISKKKKSEELFEIKEVPIFSSGLWKGINFTVEDLDEIVKNTNLLIKQGLIDPPVKLGHDEEQGLLQADGYPAGGYVVKIYRFGDTIFADIKDVPLKLYEAVKKKAYKKVSAEIYNEYVHPKTKEKIGKVLKAIAFLGADVPAVKGLGDILALYNTEKNVECFVFSEEDFNKNKNKEAVNMSKETKKTWTLAEVKEKIPCCYRKVEEIMTKEEMKEIDTDRLAKIIFDETQKKDETKIQCPPGYKWDTEKSRCIPDDVNKKGEQKDKDMEQKVCPEGYKWDEKQGKCVKIETAGEGDTAGASFENKLAKILLDILGIKIDENKPISEQVTEQEIMQKVNEMTEKKKDKKDKNIKDIVGDIDIDKVLKDKKDEIANVEVEKFPNDARPPKDWWDSCREAVSDKTDTPEKLCGWIWYNKVQKSTDENKNNVVNNSEENDKVKELKQKIANLEKEKYFSDIQKIIDDNRGVLLPAFDEYIKSLTNYFVEDEKTIKFADSEIKAKDLFKKFLNEIANKKTVIFSELTKGIKENENIEVNETEKEKLVSKFADMRKPVFNDELAILAEKIAVKQNISYRDALKQAQKLIENKKS